MLMSQTPSKDNFSGSGEIALMLAVKQNLFYPSVTGEMLAFSLPLNFPIQFILKAGQTSRLFNKIFD